MNNIYQEGSEVYDTENPSEKLIIRRYVDRIYYCQIKSDPTQREKVFFERELSPGSMSKADSASIPVTQVSIWQ